MVHRIMNLEQALKNLSTVLLTEIVCEFQK